MYIKKISVCFAHIPDRWFSNGTYDMKEAVLLAEKKIRINHFFCGMKLWSIKE